MNELLWQYAIVAAAIGWAAWSIARRGWRLLRASERGCGSESCGGCGSTKTTAPLVTLTALGESSIKAGR